MSDALLPFCSSSANLQKTLGAHWSQSLLHSRLAASQKTLPLLSAYCVHTALLGTRRGSAMRELRGPVVQQR